MMSSEFSSVSLGWLCFTFRQVLWGQRDPQWLQALSTLTAVDLGEKNVFLNSSLPSLLILKSTFNGLA